jgi:DHA2 family multidrug resistance protein
MTAHQANFNKFLEAKFFSAGASASSARLEAMGLLYRSLQQQASLLAYADNFRMLAYLSLLCIPPVLFFRRMRKH